MNLQQALNAKTLLSADLVPYEAHEKSAAGYIKGRWEFNGYGLASILVFHACYLGDEDSIKAVLDSLNKVNSNVDWATELGKIKGNNEQAKLIQEALAPTLPNHSGTKTVRRRGASAFSLHPDAVTTRTEDGKLELFYMCSLMLKNALAGNSMAVKAVCSVLGSASAPEPFDWLRCILGDVKVQHKVIKQCAKDFADKLESDEFQMHLLTTQFEQESGYIYHPLSELKTGDDGEPYGNNHWVASLLLHAVVCPQTGLDGEKALDMLLALMFDANPMLNVSLLLERCKAFDKAAILQVQSVAAEGMNKKCDRAFES